LLSLTDAEAGKPGGITLGSVDNKPVAWMDANDKTIISNEKKWANDIPLYTHPAKTLTDAETALKSLYEAVIRYENLSPFPDNYAVESCKYQLHDAKEKAKAVLKKASEK
jgi:hypothetical protein